MLLRCRGRDGPGRCSTDHLNENQEDDMTAALLDGKAISAQIQAETKTRVDQFVAAHGRQPKLAAVLVGDDPASQVYVRNKERACHRVGIESQLIRMPADSTGR